MLRQRGSHDHRIDGDAAPQAICARLRDLLQFNSISTRDALWAAQLLERKAAVAHWRSSAFGQRDRRSRQSTGERRA